MTGQALPLARCWPVVIMHALTSRFVDSEIQLIEVFVLACCLPGLCPQTSCCSPQSSTEVIVFMGISPATCLRKDQSTHLKVLLIPVFLGILQQLVFIDGICLLISNHP